MNIGMIPNTIPALAFVSRHDFAVSVEFAGVVLESYPVRVVQSSASENALNMMSEMIIPTTIITIPRIC